MNQQEIDQFLRSVNESEAFYLANPGQLSPKYINMEKHFVDGVETLRFTQKKLLENEIVIVKDSRFTFVPFYTHSNINLNFIYSGECTYLIKDKYITLKKGDICVFDKDVVRSKMKTGENDIVLNVSLSYKFFDNGILSHVGKQSIIANFLINAISNSETHDSYMIFNSSSNNHITDLFLSILYEYYNQNIYANETIESYLSLIFIELIRLYLKDPDNQVIQTSKKDSTLVIDIIKYIESNYVSCTLEEVAQEFGYHPKYLSSFIKQKLGKNFKEIQTTQRLQAASNYLKNTDHSIQEIAHHVGFKNLTQFYKKFQDQFQVSPKQYREKNI